MVRETHPVLVFRNARGHPWGRAPGNCKPSARYICSIEFVMLVLLLFVPTAVPTLWTLPIWTRQRWHRRWLEYRRLAESLRHMRILAPLGAGGPVDRPSRSSDVGGFGLGQLVCLVA